MKSLQWLISDPCPSQTGSSTICFARVSLQGEGLCFPKDHWFDANAVLEDGYRRNLQR